LSCSLDEEAYLDGGYGLLEDQGTANPDQVFLAVVKKDESSHVVHFAAPKSFDHLYVCVADNKETRATQCARGSQSFKKIEEGKAVGERLVYSAELVAKLDQAIVIEHRGATADLIKEQSFSFGQDDSSSGNGQGPLRLVHCDQTAEELLAAHNRIRTGRGLKPLFLNDHLCKAAMEHAQYLSRTGYKSGFSGSPLSHYRNGTPQSRAAAAGYTGTQTYRENYYWNMRSVQGAVNGWMASSGHAVQIVSVQVNEVGFGVVKGTGPNGDWHWVAAFGRSAQ